jgi:hypothetical protein
LKGYKNSNSQNSIKPLTTGELISLAEAAQLSGFSHKYLRDITEKDEAIARQGYVI